MLGMVTFTNGPSLSERAQSVFAQITLDPHTTNSRFQALAKMSNEDKARAAAAQLVIDDEPDDWWVAIAELWERANKLTRMVGTSGSTAQAAQVCQSLRV